MVLEKGRQACTTPLLARMDADDVMHQDRLGEDLEMLNEFDVGLFSLHPAHQTHNFPGKLLAICTFFELAERPTLAVRKAPRYPPRSPASKGVQNERRGGSEEKLS